MNKLRLLKCTYSLYGFTANIVEFVSINWCGYIPLLGGHNRNGQEMIVVLFP